MNAKNYSTTFIETVTALEGSEFPLDLVEITHADLATPLRVVNDREDVVHNGDTFIAMGFEITKPDEPEHGNPQAQLVIDNVGKELVSWLEIADWSQQTSVRLIQILRSDPNTVQWDTTLGMHDIKLSSTKVFGTLSFDNLFGLPAVPVVYSPQVAVGLF